MSFTAMFDSKVNRSSKSAFIAIVAFWAGLIRFSLSDIAIVIGTWNIKFGDLDATLLAAWLTPCFALYWGRRYSDSQEAVAVIAKTTCPEVKVGGAV